MAEVRTYNYRYSGWQPQSPPLYDFPASSSDQKLVVSSTCVSFAAFDTGTTVVWWASHPNGGDFAVRFGTNAPSPTCGMYFRAGDFGVWSSSMAACARFVAITATAASLVAVPLP